MRYDRDYAKINEVLFKYNVLRGFVRMKGLTGIRRHGSCFEHGRLKHAVARTKTGIRLALCLLVMVAGGGAMVAFSAPARALEQPPPIDVPADSGAGGTCYLCACHSAATATLRTIIVSEHLATRLHISNEFGLHRVNFVIDRFFRLFVLKAMMHMTQQLSAVAMQQMAMLGSMLDAKHQLERQRVLQQLQAEAHRDYHPSIDMCIIGTDVRNMATAMRRGQVASHVLSERFLDRQLNNQFTSAGYGRGEEREDRMEQFFQRYCEVHDMNDGFTQLCPASGMNAPNVTQNMDIDYASLVDGRLTIDANFTNPGVGAADSDEAAIYAMASNLYNHDVFEPPTAADLAATGGDLSGVQNHRVYTVLRGIAAKRSVAFNSFATIVGMKSSGPFRSQQVRTYMGTMMSQLGMTNVEEINAYIGQNPSYHAQMEMLTKKIYQRPEFFTNLYGPVADIERKQAAMRAIGLMQNFDMFKSRTRNEAMLAVLLELEVETEQNRILDGLQNAVREGTVIEAGGGP